MKKSIPQKNKSLPWYLLLALLGTILSYWGIWQLGFLSWDDNVYVYENILIRRLSSDGLYDIFRNFVMGNYHPLVILSYALEYAVVGNDPWLYHLNNLLLHVVTTGFVYALAYRMSGHTLVAGVCALFFGVHPIHVESVAWVTERKDVLYGVFYISAMLSWDYWRSTGKRSAWVLTLILFILSCLSKGQAVTLPLALILMDIFRGKRPQELVKDVSLWLMLLPALAFGLLAVYAQRHGGNIRDAADWSVFDQFLIGCRSLLFYLPKYIFPWPLVPFYPYPKPPLGLIWLTGPIFIAGCLWAIWKGRKRFPEITFGVSFYLLHVLPVAQFLPVGNAIAADRYFYIPALGLTFATAVLMVKYLKPRLLFALVGMLALIWGFMTRAQMQVWNNTESFFSYIIRIDPSVDFAFVNLGRHLEKQDRKREAVDVYLKGIAVNPLYPDQYNDAGYTLSHLGKYDSSLLLLNKALELSPNLAEAYNNLGYTYSMMQRFEEAEKQLLRSIELNAKNETAYNNLGSTYSMMGRMEDARSMYYQAIQIKPDYADAFNNLGSNYGMSGNNDKALEYFEKAIRYRPDFGGAWFNAGIALQMTGNQEKALSYYRKAASLGHQPAIDFLKSQPQNP
jgi:tetratricopeptide (TPR) repeat protein